MTDAAAANHNPPPVTHEFGVVGMKRSGGTIIEEYLPQLRGESGRKVYNEMVTEPVIGGVVLAMTEVIGRLDWKVVPPDTPTAEEVSQAQFVQECLEDMDDSWDVTLAQVLSMIQYGWAYHEVVYKFRNGQSADPTQRSRFSDGRIGWRKFAIRAQDSLAEWLFAPNGDLRGMVQQDNYTGAGRRVIPIERALLFRTDEYKGNPEGRSMLRSAYRPWFFKKRIEEIEAIGIERDLAGMPRVYAPNEWFATENDPNLARLKEMVTKAKRNEMDGVLLPSLFDGEGNRMLSFDLVGSGGARQVDTNAVVARYNNAIATSVLMDFLTLGHEGVGSYALGAAKISMWQLVVESLAKSIASVVNRHAVPQLMRLNGWRPDRMPQLTYGDVAQVDLSVLGAFLQQMIDTGIIVPDEQLENYARELLNLPSASGMGRDSATPPSVPQPPRSGDNPDEATAAPLEAPAAPEPTAQPQGEPSVGP
jgi:hypothetical protein